jgi:hypothetical protein
MAYTTADARQQLLDTVAQATEAIGAALAALGEAYELVDERSGDALEKDLFRPVQLAYGRAKRTHTGFAERHGLPTRSFDAVEERAPARGVKGLLDDGVDATRRADELLATLQDSMLPVEVGDAELRAGLEDVRGLLDGLQGRAREFVRTLGR